MLHFILGRAGYGKTEYVFSSIKRLIDSGEKNILLITPEQFSFIAERRLLDDLGESDVSKVENASFSRLSSEISKKYGGDELPLLSKGGKAVIMKKAIEMVEFELELFKNNTTSPAFINSAIKIYDEMKACRVSIDDINDAIKATERESLKQKLSDISKIIMAYDAIIENKYYDSANELTRLYEKLLNHNYFENRTVFIDGFYGFVAQEYKIIEVILKQAKDVFVTFCTDSFYNKDKYDLFSYINSNVAILKDVAVKSGVRIANPIILKENQRCFPDALKLVEKNAFLNESVEFSDIDAVKIYSAKNISDECDRVALEISKLLRQGYHANEIAVATRALESYKKELEFSFDKFNIPYFNDERQSISSQPVIMFVNFLLRTAIYSFRSDDIFSLLKTGLTALGCDEISELENYVYMWNINDSAWKKDFVNSTKGFAPEITENDQKKIDALNKSRAYVVDILSKFVRSAKDKNSLGICKSIYYTLIDFNCDEQLKKLAIQLDENGKSALAKQQGRVWDLLMEILDTLARLGESEKISLNEFYKMFNLMVKSEDLGTLPTGLDNVQLGSADRMRFDSPRVVFVVGANEGEFPQSVGSSGLLSETDRIALIDNKFKLYSYGETLNAQERFFAYMAMSAPREKLYVSYKGGDNATESSIITYLTTLFPDIKIQHFSCNFDIDDVESVDNAFEILASNYTENNEFISSVKSYFNSKEEYSGRIKAVESLTENVNPEITDKSLSTQLFGKNMYLSASRIEDYYNCAFRYFCKFGIGARPRSKAEMDPMQTGTVIHYVLEQIIKNNPKNEFVALSSMDIKIMVDRCLMEFLETQMGDSNQFTKRFKYQFMRLSKMLVYVVERLKEEFEQSDFEAKAFELTIGDGSRGEEVKYVPIQLADGGSITIKGAVDRVDIYESGGKRYVRVVDYKSGNKQFSLSDIMYGLNLQMFIYLFTLCKTENKYSGIESGVLYMHSAREVLSVERSAGANDVKKKENTEFKMKGIVLNDEEHSIAEHMEHDLAGKYIPVKNTKTKGITGNIVSLEELGRISRKIDMLIAEMGISLHNGVIAQNPVNYKNHDKTCEFCDYSDVCLNRKEVELRDLEDLDDRQVLDKIKEELDATMD